LTDIQIAQSAAPLPIAEIAGKLGLCDSEWIPYGRHSAKVVRTPDSAPRGKLILVTAVNPTPAGEGKTTVSVGLADGLSRIGQKTALCLREPSLGPVFGMKGGAAGGGKSQVIPMEDINLHFNGDLHAVSSANNLLSAAIDNHIHFGNSLRIDPRRVSWRRCMDMNDRALRNITIGLGGPVHGMPRESGFDITAASEVMAILCLAKDLRDLRERLGKIIIAADQDGKAVTCADLRVQGAMTALLQNAIYPNLAQTLEYTPTLIHGGAFANIAHGCNTLIATRTAMSLADITVTEAGFGADLGAEKFLNIKCRQGGLWPGAVVIVVTARAVRHHGGFDNLGRHIHNVRNGFGLPAVVAVNQFTDDTQEELESILSYCRDRGVAAVLASGWAEGGAGCEALARQVLSSAQRSTPKFTYALEETFEEKIRALAQEIYGAENVDFSPAAKKSMTQFEDMGFGSLPVCMAKTQYSLSDDPKKNGAPRGFTLFVRSFKVSAGAGFAVAMTGEILSMPGLPRTPSYEQVDIGEDGKLSGLF